MTAQLDLYNGALRILGQTQLATITENVEARRYLDGVWSNDAIRYCLEQGYWYFATRTEKIDPDPDVATTFGYKNAFTKPTDWVRTCMVATDEYFRLPLTRVRDETGYWFADTNPLFVSFVSDDPAYGNNLAGWPPSFAQYFQAYLAAEIAPKLAPSKVDMAIANRKSQLKDAKSKAAMNESATFPPPGAWMRSRMGRTSGFDRGNTGSLIG